MTRLLPSRRTTPLHQVLIRALGALASFACVAATLGQPGAAQPQPSVAAVPAHRQADNVAIIPIREEISRITVYSFLRRLQLAEQGGADAVVIELDTPGGEVLAVQEICNAIRDCPITNSVAWVHTRAYSGGAIVALACKEIVTSNSAQMGDALPIIISRMSVLQPLPEAERQKITAPLLAEVVNSARLRGWDEYVVQGFVALGVELWWVRDKATGEELAINEAEYRMLFDGDPPRTRPILAAAPGSSGSKAPPAESPDTSQGPAPPGEGAEAYRPASPALAAMSVEPETIGRQSARRTISPGEKGRFELVGYLCSGDGPLILNADELVMLGFAANKTAQGALDPIQTDADLSRFLGAKNVRRLEANWSEWLVRALSHNVTRGLLIVIFLIAIFLEMSHPGVGLPGIIALIALIALLAPPAMIGLASWWEIGAIVAGILLVILEVFVLPGFGVPGVLGLLLIFGGLLGTFVGDSPGGLFPNSPQQQNNLMYGMITMLLSFVTAGIAMYYLAKHFGSLPILGRLILSDDADSGDALLATMPNARDTLPKRDARGRTITPLRPSGRAQFGDTVVDVVCDFGYVEAGDTVRVVSADKFRVVVERVGPETGSA